MIFISQHSDNACRCFRKYSRTNRLIRFLCTAIPTFLETVKPSRLRGELLFRILATKKGLEIFFPSRLTAANSDLFNSRSFLVKEKSLLGVVFRCGIIKVTKFGGDEKSPRLLSDCYGSCFVFIPTPVRFTGGLLIRPAAFCPSLASF